MNRILKERWKPIPSFIGSYEISNYGRVRSLERFCNTLTGIRRVPEKILKPGRSTYLTVGLCRGTKGNRKTFPIHKLVAILFVSNPKGYKYINHDDCDKYNNFYKNLKWCSAKQNVDHAKKNGLMRWHNGEKNGMAKLTSKKVIRMRLFFAKGMRNMDIASKFGISRAHVTAILQKKRWKHI